jgi:cardiolipin synthase
MTRTENKIWTIPNLLSFFRLGLIFLFGLTFLTDQPLWAISIFALSGITDFLDGWIARRFNQTSWLGEVIDPLADRIFIFLSLILTGIKGVLPWWAIVLILVRELLMIPIMLNLIMRGYRPIRVIFMGKAGTAMIYFSIPIMLVGHYFVDLSTFFGPLGWACLLWGLALYWITGFYYLVSALRVKIQRLGSESVPASEIFEQVFDRVTEIEISDGETEAEVFDREIEIETSDRKIE